MPKAYPPEFRRRALNLIQAGRSVVQVAADLGISQGLLYSWRKQEPIDTGQMPGLSSVQSAGLTTARRRIRELEAENEILRRASLAFKDVVPPKEPLGPGRTGRQVHHRSCARRLGRAARVRPIRVGR